MATHAHLRKKRAGFFLKFSLIICNLPGLLNVSAQDMMNKDSLERDGLNQNVIKKRLFSVYASVGFSQKAKLERETGEYRVTSTPQPAGELGFNLLCNLNNNFFFITGLTGTITGRNAIVDVPAHQINPLYPDRFPPMTISDVDFCATIPFEIEKDWQLEKSRLIYGRIGLNLKYSFGYDEEGWGNYLTDTSNQHIDVFSLDMNSDNHNKPWLTYKVSGGYGWALKNHNLIKLGLVANISFTKFVSGTYQVTIPGHPLTQGSYGVTGSYLALSFSYTFVRFQKP